MSVVIFFDIDDTLLDDWTATRAAVTELHRVTGPSGLSDDLMSRWVDAIERHFPGIWQATSVIRDSAATA